MSPIELFWTAKDIQIYRYTDASICVIGRSEKYKSWVLQKAKEISEPRHSTDFRTVFGIMIGQLSSCEIWQKFLTEYRGRLGIMMRPNFK